MQIIENVKILSSATIPDIKTGDIVINDGKILDIGPDCAKRWKEKADQIIQGNGRLVMPGLINAHFHSTSAFMKGAIPGMPLEPYMLLEAPLDTLSHSPRLYYLRAMLSAIDMLKQGVVALRDDVHFFGPPEPANASAILEAYQQAGIRASVGFGIPNVLEHTKIPKLETFLTTSQHQAMQQEKRLDTAQILAFYNHVFAEWHGTENGRLTIHTSCSTPHRVDEATLRALSELAQDRNVSFDTHLLETKTQYVHAWEREQKTLVQYLHDCGALTEHLIAIHSIWTDEHDLDLIADSGAVVAHNPVSNLKLGSGVMPLIPMLQRQIPVALGTDEASVDEANNLWINGKLATLLQSLTSRNHDDWPDAPDVLKMMLDGGARAMRRQQSGGKLQKGYDADLIMLDLRNANYMPHNDLRRHLVLGEHGQSVELVMVAGHIVMQNGKLTRIDEQAIYDEICEIWPRYDQARLAANRETADLLPAYTQSTQYAFSKDVPLNRFVEDPAR